MSDISVILKLMNMQTYYLISQAMMECFAVLRNEENSPGSKIIVGAIPF